MHRYVRYYIRANDTLDKRLSHVSAAKFSNDLSCPARFGISGGSFPGWIGSEAHLRAKFLFLVRSLEAYGMEDTGKEEFRSVFSKLAISEESFDCFFLLAHGTQIRPKVSVNADDYVRGGINPAIGQYIALTGNTRADRYTQDVIEHGIQRHKR